MAERRLHSTAFNALFTRKKSKHVSKYWCKRCIDGPSYKKGHAATCPLASKQGDSTETDKQRYYNQAFKFLLSHRGRMAEIEGEPWYKDLLQLARRAKHVVGVGPLCKNCYSRTSKKTKDHRDRADPNAGEGYSPATTSASSARAATVCESTIELRRRIGNINYSLRLPGGTAP